MLGVRLALDIGKARIGVAKSDAMGILASPFETVHRSEGDESFIAELLQIAADNSCIVIYVGDPINLKNRATESTSDSRNVALKLKEAGFEVRLLDERLTTVTAQARLHETGKNVKNSRSIIDQVAAAVLLQHALDIEEQTAKFAGTEVEL